MKKSILILASCVMSISLMSGAAAAKSDNSNGKGNQATAKPAAKPAATTTTETKNKEKEKQKEEVKQKDKEKASVTTVTYATYNNKGHNGYKGLLNAMGNVKDKPAGAVIANLLLTKYNTQLTDEMKAELEAIKEQDAALSAFAELLKEQGSVTDAVYVQKEAILANVKNLDSYKKLGKMYEQAGKKGVKLYVNGVETSPEVAPILTSGSTLVPFKAIAEALNAEVVWNQKERSVTVTRDGITVKLFIDKKTAYVNGQSVTLQTAPAVVKGSTVVPARFVSEALKATVKWEPETQSVVIYEE